MIKRYASNEKWKRFLDGGKFPATAAKITSSEVITLNILTCQQLAARDAEIWEAARMVTLSQGGEVPIYETLADYQRSKQQGEG